MVFTNKPSDVVRKEQMLFKMALFCEFLRAVLTFQVLLMFSLDVLSLLVSVGKSHEASLVLVRA